MWKVPLYKLFPIQPSLSGQNGKLVNLEAANKATLATDYGYYSDTFSLNFAPYLNFQRDSWNIIDLQVKIKIKRFFTENSTVRASYRFLLQSCFYYIEKLKGGSGKGESAPERRCSSW